MELYQYYLILALIALVHGLLRGFYDALLESIHGAYTMAKRKSRRKRVDNRKKMQKYSRKGKYFLPKGRSEYRGKGTSKFTYRGSGKNLKQKREERARTRRAIFLASLKARRLALKNQREQKAIKKALKELKRAQKRAEKGTNERWLESHPLVPKSSLKREKELLSLREAILARNAERARKALEEAKAKASQEAKAKALEEAEKIKKRVKQQRKSMFKAAVKLAAENIDFMVCSADQLSSDDELAVRAAVREVYPLKPRNYNNIITAVATAACCYNFRKRRAVLIAGLAQIKHTDKVRLVGTKVSV